MGKKKAADVSKASAKAAKKAKATQKIEKKASKKASKSKADDESDDDLESVLEQMRREWEDAHKVTEEVAMGPPSRRANATLTPCPNGAHIWCIGGEFFSDDGKAYFYNDVFRYNPEKDEWRKFISPTCPGPRSAHAVAASAAGGGKLFLFGGEFSSLHQNSFHHYRDFWCFDITTHSWDRIETKVKPTARSGHRMAVWKHYIVLFGGFYDLGIANTKYLNDLWIFDTQEYKWKQVEFKPMERMPKPRSGFSFLPTPDGIIMHGGYCKEYSKGKRPIGVMLEDTWFLSLSISTTDVGNSKAGPPLIIKWEPRKRPSTAYAPSLRSGCTMAAWVNKNTGVMFGGVSDEDTNEETLESIFHNDLNGYQWIGKGKWVSMMLKRPKKNQKKVKRAKTVARDGNKDEDVDDGGENVPDDLEQEIDPDDPILTIPFPRYNAMLTVLRNTLFIYGGIFERGSKEYTLDDFYSLQLDKMDKFVCLKKSEIAIAEEQESSSDEDEDEDEEGDEDEDDNDNDNEDDRTVFGEEQVEEEVEKLKIVEEEGLVVEDVQPSPVDATVAQDILKDNAAQLVEDVQSTPLPGETLAMFYARTREYWTGRAHNVSDNRGKSLRRDGFALAEERYIAYKPTLRQVEKILEEAGLDEDEMRKGAAAGGMKVAQSRNRR